MTERADFSDGAEIIDMMTETFHEYSDDNAATENIISASFPLQNQNNFALSQAIDAIKNEPLAPTLPAFTISLQPLVLHWLSLRASDWSGEDGNLLSLLESSKSARALPTRKSRVGKKKIVATKESIHERRINDLNN